MTAKSLTQEYLKEILEYNPDTGLFTWIKRISNIKVGDIAGSIGNHGYIQMCIKSKKHLAHRLAFLYMTGKLPENQTDHINHIRTDNRWKNLREATNQENHKNRPRQNNNKSGTTGVYWHKKGKKWVAEIKLDGKHEHLGFFEDIKWAIFARWLAEDKHGFHPNHGK